MLLKNIYTLIILITFQLSYAQQFNALRMTLLDVGAGQSTVLSIPGKSRMHYVVYDLGPGYVAMDDIPKLIPPGSIIDWVIISHTDADHIGAVTKLLDAYEVKHILRTGFPKSVATSYLGSSPKNDTRTYRLADAAILAENDCRVYNIHQLGQLNLLNCDPNEDQPYFPLLGKTIQIGDATMTILGAWPMPPGNLDNLHNDLSEWLNSISIVVRFDYNKSILLTGDTVGRVAGSRANAAPIAGEEYMLDHFYDLLDVDILQLGHHGGDDFGSKRFLEATSPEYVVIPSGHKHRHPHESTLDRVVRYGGTDPFNILRTDKDDDEPASSTAQAHQRQSNIGRGHQALGKDKSGDDHIDVWLGKDGSIDVSYCDFE